MARWTRRLGYLTFVLAIIAGISAWILEKTDQTLRGNLAAIKASNRASVFFRDMARGQTSENDQSTNWTFIPNLENNGNTQTKNAKLETACDKETIKKLFDGQSKPLAPRVFGPKQVNGSGACTWTSKGLDQLRLQRRPVYVGGIIEYDDIFGGHHTTKYCREIYIISDPNPRGTNLEHTIALCLDFLDCADEECKQQN